ncbi:MAG: hypothetical protein U9O89_01790 [Thermoproteota archaeon]|nr:hypothetical protein [Thermoproteota archaeon]
MSEKKELYGKAKEEMRLSERILAELPGFRGYKEKELRRETDRLIRNHLYRKLTDARSDLKNVFQKLSKQRRYEVLTDMDHLVMKFDRVAEKINHASYGYTGFFNVVKVGEGKLDKMIEFDSQLINHVQKIVDETADFKKETAEKKFEKAGEHIEKLDGSLDSLEKTFSERGEVILGVK